MSNPRTDALLATWLRPRVVFPMLAALVLLSVLLTPQPDNDTAPNLTITSTAPGGAAGFADALGRLGWRVTRSIQAIPDTLSTDDIHAVLAPARALSATATHAMLESVRRGASVLVVFADGTALADSLKLDYARRPGQLTASVLDNVTCPGESRIARSLRMMETGVVEGLRARAPLPSDTAVFAWTNGTRTYPAVLGIPMGRGRLAVVAEDLMLTNDAVRTCRSPAGVAAVRAVEWLSVRDTAPRRNNIVFEEHGFGFGRHPSMVRAARGWLVHSSSGRTTLQLAVAALLLLAAFAPRPIAPIATATMPRRSPLEHVGALARAYEQVGGTRTATRRLVQGLRRRSLRPAAPHAATDDEFLSDVGRRVPAVRPHVETIQRALHTTVTPGELIGVAECVDHIERALHR